jgi:anthranilate phosphoribosyltransferase
VRTVFNVLGPLTNPAGARRQLMGVYHDRLVRVAAEVLARLGSERAWVVHGRDGLDELTVYDKTHVAELARGAVSEFEVDPVDLGLAHTDRGPVAGGTPTENAARIRAIFAGEQGAARDIVLLNTAAALVVAEAARNLEEGIQMARQAIDSGGAAAKLDELAHFRA